jgi:hypothetical protein
VQLPPPAASALVQSFATTAKSPAFVPVICGGPGTPDGTPPELTRVRVTGDDVAPSVVGPSMYVPCSKASLAGGAAVPDSVAATVPPGVPDTVSEACKLPEALPVGAKYALITHVPPVAASVAPAQVDAAASIANSPASLPVSNAASAPVGVPPLLVTVNATSLLVVP